MYFQILFSYKIKARSISSVLPKEYRKLFSPRRKV